MAPTHSLPPTHVKAQISSQLSNWTVGDTKSLQSDGPMVDFWPVFSSQVVLEVVFVLKPQSLTLLGRAVVDGAGQSQGRRVSTKEQRCL